MCAARAVCAGVGEAGDAGNLALAGGTRAATVPEDRHEGVCFFLGDVGVEVLAPADVNSGIVDVLEEGEATALGTLAIHGLPDRLLGTIGFMEASEQGG